MYQVIKFQDPTWQIWCHTLVLTDEGGTRSISGKPESSVRCFVSIRQNYLSDLVNVLLDVIKKYWTPGAKLSFFVFSLFPAAFPKRFCLLPRMPWAKGFPMPKRNAFNFPWKRSRAESGTASGQHLSISTCECHYPTPRGRRTPGLAPAVIKERTNKAMSWDCPSLSEANDVKTDPEKFN